MLTLAQKLADPQICVGMVSIMGQVAPDTPFDPDNIGAMLLALHRQSADTFQPELFFHGTD